MKKITLQGNLPKSIMPPEELAYDFFSNFPFEEYKHSYVKRKWIEFKKDNVKVYGRAYAMECERLAKLYLLNYDRTVNKAPVLTYGEQEQKLSEISNPRHRAMFAFLFGFGLRSAELISIRRKDVTKYQLENIFKLSVRLYGTKTGDGMAICEENIYCNEIWNFISYKDDDELIFPNLRTGEQGTVDIIRSAMRLYGIKKTHSGRRSLATLSIIDGESIELVRAKLRHSSINTTREYLSVENEVILRQRLEKVS